MFQLNWKFCYSNKFWAIVSQLNRSVAQLDHFDLGFKLTIDLLTLLLLPFLNDNNKEKETHLSSLFRCFPFIPAKL